MTKLNKKMGLIGAGNMGTAIVEGLLKQKMVEPSSVWVYDKINEKSSAFAKGWKVNLASSNEDLAKNTDVLLLAIKPQDLESTAQEMKPALTAQHEMISILAGVPLAKLQSSIGQGVVVRAMPNLGARVSESITAITSDSQEALETAQVVFSGCGKVVQLEESFFDLVTAISGSGPAYFFLLMELLAKAGVNKGLDDKTANLLAVQTALGAALLAQKSSVSPGELRQMVTSKGGTTEAALKTLESGNYAELFQKAVDAALQRGKELGG